MRVESFYFDAKKGWSTATFPQLDSPNTVVFVFGAPVFLTQPDAIKDLKAAFPKAIHIGCSTSGEIYGKRILDNSLSVAVVEFAKTKVRYAHSSLQGQKDSFEAGVAIAEQLRSPDLKGVFVLSEGLQVNGSELVKGINSKIAKDVVVTGGLAGDGDRFQKTWVLAENGPTTGGVSAVGLYGNHIRIGHGSKGGWDIFGPSRTITKSQGNVLYELDNKPALDLYRQYLGERAKELPASGLLFPLAIRESASASKSLVRTILAIDEKNNTLTFAGDIPQGWSAQLMRANFDRLIDGASFAANMASSNLNENLPGLLLSISCVGRRLVLGERSEEEVEATVTKFPHSIKQIGFYSYGEISPFVHGDSCDLHNQTMTLTMLSEAA